VYESGCRSQGLECGFWGLGFGVWILELEVKGLRLRV